MKRATGVFAAAALLLTAAWALGQNALPASSVAAVADSGQGGFFDDLLRTYTPRRLCMNQEPAVVWLHVFSDLLIAASYFSIPVALLVFVRRRRDLAFNWMFVLFAVFISACGVTHLIGVWDIWQAFYRVDGLVKLFTALASAATAVLLWRLIPAAVALPSPQELATANAELRTMRLDLERRVDERTRELADATDRERDARAEAEHANRAKDEFLATLSHELRTPLHAIVGWSHILANENASPEVQRKGIEVIRRNARVQSQLVEDLLDMSRIVSGNIRLDVRETDPAAVIDAALETVEPAALAKGILLHKQLDRRAGPVRADPARLQQILWNLLSNAVKFTPKSGRVSVTLERVEAQVVIRVADTGRGISPALMPHIFERFRQDDSSMSRHQGGLGLGLAIVRHLVELHGGTVHASSPGEGQGSTFTVSLPVASAPHEPAATVPVNVAASVAAMSAAPVATDAAATRVPPASPAAASAESFAGLLAGVKVLMVDDEADARQLFALLLSQAGAEVRTASSAAEALAVLAEFRPAVLVSDLGMPGEDGLSLMRKLRQLAPEAGGATPALALTAFAQPEDRHAALVSGFQRHLAKPVDPGELLLCVAGLAGRGSHRTG